MHSFASSIRVLRAPSGMTLTELVTTMAISTVVAGTIATVMINQQREMVALNQRLAAIELERSLIATLSTGSVCEYVTDGLTFNGSGVSTATPRTLAVNQPIPSWAKKNGAAWLAGPPMALQGGLVGTQSQSMTINQTQLVIDQGPPGVPPIGPGVGYSGYWEVTFDPAGMIRPLNPIRVGVLFVTDTTVLGATRITGCQATASNAPIPAPPGRAVGGSYCHPAFFGACLTWNYWGDCSGATSVTTGMIDNGFPAAPTGSVCFSN